MTSLTEIFQYEECGILVLLSDICRMPKGRKLKTSNQLLGLLLSGSLNNHVVKNEEEKTLTCRPCNWTRPINRVFTQRASVHFKSTCHLNKSWRCLKKTSTVSLLSGIRQKNRSLIDFLDPLVPKSSFQTELLI